MLYCTVSILHKVVAIITTNEDNISPKVWRKQDQLQETFVLALCATIRINAAHCTVRS